VHVQMVLKGHIYRGRKPVNWSPSSRTALAEAELEYPEGHKSKSIYVSMPVRAAPEGASAELVAALNGAALAIWTTTPWTIPANLAVAVNEALQYSIVEVRLIPCVLCSLVHAALKHAAVRSCHTSSATPSPFATLSASAAWCLAAVESPTDPQRLCSVSMHVGWNTAQACSGLAWPREVTAVRGCWK
jgi:isoleucyl-tRNA synthetase